METQDQEYQNLLKKVDSLEKQVQSIEGDMGKVVKRQHEILSMDKDNLKPNENKYQGVEKDAYDILVREKEKLTDRKYEDDILKKKIMLWISQHAVMFEIESKVKNEDDFFIQLKVLQASIKRRLGDKEKK